MREYERQNLSVPYDNGQTDGSSVNQSTKSLNNRNDITNRTLGFFEKHRRLIIQIRSLVDVLIVLFSATIAFFFKHGTLNFSTADGFAVLLVILLMMVTFTQAGLYRHWRRRSIWLEIRTLALAWLIVISTLSLIPTPLKLVQWYQEHGFFQRSRWHLS